MIHIIIDPSWRSNESDDARIQRWIDNARREIADATPKETALLAEVTEVIKRRPDTYAWGEARLLGMQCHWLTMIVEPDRSAVVAERLEAILAEQEKAA